MFNTRQRIKQLEEENERLQVAEVKNANKHENDMDKLRLKHRVELDEVKHLVKLKEEKLDIQHEKEKLTMVREYVAKTAELQQEHHETILQTIADAQNDLKLLYMDIMKRLPQVKVGVKQEIK